MDNDGSDTNLSGITKDELRDMIACRVGHDRVPGKINIITDISDFFNVDFDDVVMLGGQPYFIRHCALEGRFGLEDEPKFWVRRAICLRDGTVKIIKFVFLEKLEVRIGGFTFNCVRSPQKEARVLDLVSGHPNFMHGSSVSDSDHNIIRVIDFIYGKSLASSIPELGKNHEDYFYHHFPSMLDEFIELVKAIRFIHGHGEKHGDIRRDHIIRDNQTGKYRWIDFDFNYVHEENIFGYDLFGLGNVLVFISGRGDVTVQDLSRNMPDVFGRISPADINIIFQNRVVNLKKVYPYIPDSLNRIFLHFSQEAHVFYENTDQLLDDLYEARSALFGH